MATPPGRLRAFGRSLVAVHWSDAELLRGLWAGAFIVVPFALGVLLGYPSSGAIGGFGTLNLLMVDAPGGRRTPYRVLWLGALANPLAVGVGTLVGSTTGWLEPTLVGAALLVILLGYLRPETESVALIASVMVVVGVGLPVGGPIIAADRVVGVALGSVWALAGVALYRWRHPASAATAGPGPEPPSRPASLVGTHAAAVAVTAAIGLALGTALSLPRDIWIMLTVIVVLRLDLAGTFSYATMRIIGTVLGAAIAFVITVATGDVWVLGAVLVGSAALAFGTRLVNYIVYATGITVFVIVLLNFVYNSGPSVAGDRIVDTLIGGGLALLTGTLLWLLYERHGNHWRGNLEHRGLGRTRR